MVKILNGPAMGVRLQLRRAPLLLRVVKSRAGKWDALDQLDDEPAPTETIFVYMLSGNFARYHQRGGGKNNSGFFESGDYRVVLYQPDDAVVRDRDAWRTWCLENAERLGLAHAVPPKGVTA